MFWKFLSGFVRTSVGLSRSATALGAAIIITVGVYDLLKARRERESRQPPNTLR